MTLPLSHRIARGYYARPLTFWLKGFGELIALAVLALMLVGWLVMMPDETQHAKLRVCGFETSGDCK